MSLAALHGFPTELVRQVKELIDGANSGKIAPITALEDIWEKLHSLGHAREKVYHSDEVLCHPENRGRLGVNAHNAHKNGVEIDTVGCDFNELNKAMCFQVCPFEPKRSQQIAFNERQIQASHGMLAPLTGRECVLSVGTGHFTAWVRAVNAGCKTPFKSVADTNGRLSKERLCRKDKRFQQCLEHGWKWREFPWQSEVAWPLLPDLAQRALNASHGVSSRSTELEVMVWIAEATHDLQSSSWEEVLETARLNSPACQNYIEEVGRLSKMISGGPEAPMLHFLDRVQKAFGVNKTLGEEFVKSVVGLNLSITNKSPYLKAALVATNLLGEKLVDGVCKLITKSDVERLKGKTLRDKSLDVEAHLVTCARLVDRAFEGGLISETCRDDLLSRFMMRSILWLVDKQKHCSEKTVYKTHDDVRSAFVYELKNAAGDCDLSPWEDLGPGSSQQARKNAESDDKKDVILSLDQMNDPRVICKERGFSIGKFVREKGVDSQIFEIANIGEDVVLKQVSAFGHVCEVKVKLEPFLLKWQVYNGKVEVVLPSPSCAVMHKSVQSDAARCHAFEVVMCLEKTAENRNVLYLLNPKGLAASQDIPKGALKLYPLTFLANMVHGKTPPSTSAQIKLKENKFVFATEPPSVTTEEKSQDFAYIPYWWVKPTHVPSDVNMRLVSHTWEDGTIVQALQNTRKITKHERIMFFKEKPLRKPLEGVEEPAAKRSQVGNA